MQAPLLSPCNLCTENADAEPDALDPALLAWRALYVFVNELCHCISKLQYPL